MPSKMRKRRSPSEGLDALVAVQPMPKDHLWEDSQDLLGRQEAELGWQTRKEKPVRQTVQGGTS